MKYSYSHDEEHYHGQYDSIAEALEEAFDHEDTARCHVGVITPATQPERCLSARSMIYEVLDKLTEDETWAGEWAEPSGSRIQYARDNPEQIKELETELRKVFGAWLDKHGLRPTHWTVENVQTYTRAQYEALFTEQGK